MQVFKKAMLSGVGWYVDEADLLPRSLAPPAKVLGDFFGEADLAAGKKKERPFGRLAQASVPSCARFARSVRQHVSAFRGVSCGHQRKFVETHKRIVMRDCDSFQRVRGRPPRSQKPVHATAAPTRSGGKERRRLSN